MPASEGFGAVADVEGEMSEHVWQAGMLALFIYPVYSDLRKREFHPLPPILMALILIVTSGTFHPAGMIPGVLLLLIGRISHEQIGYGDGLFCLCLGSCMGISRMTGLLMWALLLSAAGGIFMLLAGKADRKTEMPFLPFLFAAYWLIQGWG